MEPMRPGWQLPPGTTSQRMLADLQRVALACEPRGVVLVEGLSDYFAVERIAGSCGRDLGDEAISIVPMGGATNIRRFLALFGPRGRNLPVTCLSDAAEADHVLRALRDAGVGSERLFVCDRDLEDELIRALGPTAVEAVIDKEGDLPSLRRLQQMPAHRDGSHAQHLHRFMGVRSTRKYRYARLLAEALPAEAVPRVLRQLVDSLG